MSLITFTGAFSVVVLTGCCMGGLLNTKSGRGITDELTRIPVFQDVVHASGDVIARFLNGISNVPLTIARRFGVGHRTPSFVSRTNIVSITDNFITDLRIGADNEDTKLPIKSLIIKYGFPFEKHLVITEDKYILAIHRIPGKGYPVFLMHGLLSSSDDFVIPGPENGLAYLLAKEGFDVWMGNARGNKHSRRHVTLQPKGAEFWDFSWHEIGYYDLPAMIDYVLNKTGVNKVRYIGHSQGTTTFFVMASERPEYNKKIELMIALSTVVFMENAKSPFVRLLAPATGLIHAISKSVGIYEFLPDNYVVRTLKYVICGHGPISELFCGNALFLVAGFSLAQLDVTSFPVILSHLPAGASVKQFAHYGQGVLTQQFRQFDYGVAENLERYGAKVPPSYRLDKVVAPVYMLYSNTDWLANSTDVQRLIDSLGNVADVYQVPYAPFNHYDFLFARDFKSLIYKRVQRILNASLLFSDLYGRIEN